MSAHRYEASPAKRHLEAFPLLQVPEVEPQKWALWEVWLIATTLGIVALISSVVLLVGCMKSTVLNPGGWGVIWGSSGRNYLLFAELRTIMCVRVSRMTRARQRSPRSLFLQLPQDLALGLLDTFLGPHSKLLLSTRSWQGAWNCCMRCHGNLDYILSVLVR